jgi:hypothetical protein
MIDKYNCPDFHTLVSGKPRFIVNPEEFEKNDPSSGILIQLTASHLCEATHYQISRLRKSISSYLLEQYGVLNEQQLQHLINAIQERCARVDQVLRLKTSDSEEIDPNKFRELYSEQYSHIVSIMEARNDAILQYRSVTNSKDFKNLLPSPINFKTRFSTEELLVIVGTMIQKDVLQVLEGKRPMRKQEIVKLLADYVGVLKNSGNDEKMNRSKSWNLITRSGVSTYTGLEAYKEHFKYDFSVDDDEIWLDDNSDIGTLLTALNKFSLTKKGN